MIDLERYDHAALLKRNAELLEAVRVERLKLAAAYGDEDAARELAGLATDSDAEPKKVIA